VQSLNLSQSARMHEFRDETGLWATAGSDSPAEYMLERGARADEAIPGAAPRKIEPVLPRSALAAGLWRYGPHAALAAWMIAVAWMAGSQFDPPVRTVVQQEGAQGAEMSRVAQNVAKDQHALKARVEPSAAQTLSTKDATGPGDTKPGLEAAKIEMSGGLPEASGKVERLRPKSSEKASKASERFDRIGLEIAALLATAAPAADRSIAAAPIARRQARSVRHDAFDPSLNPTAPGAPRPLGTVAATTTAINASRSGLGL
jgi:hypothetical protein